MRRLALTLALVAILLLLLTVAVGAEDPYYDGRRGVDGENPPVGAGDTALTFTGGAGSRSCVTFAGCIMAQGDPDGTGADVFSFSRGSQISGHWYQNWDSYQGTVNLWWTPEYDYDSSLTGVRYLFYASTNYHAEYDYANDRYSFTAGSQTITAASNVAAGTTYGLAFSWDTTGNDIDGTNGCRISINDAHTYGCSTTPTASAPDATIYIGSDGTDGASNGLIEGFAVYRDGTWWDGDYGINLGQGDVINLTHGGSDQDPTLSTGGWGVNLMVPTDSTPAKAGASWTGQGWSMRHSSNIVASGWFTSGTTGWATKGTVSSSGVLTATSRIFLGGAYVENTAVDSGLTYAVAGATAGDDLVFRAIVHEVDESSGIALPKLVITDTTNGALIVDVNADWRFEKVTNGDFGADTWDKGTGWSIAAGVASSDGSQTGNSNLTQTANNQQNGGIEAGNFYRVVFTVDNRAAGGIRPRLGTTDGTLREADGTYTEILQADSSELRMRADLNFIGDIDDVSVVPWGVRANPWVIGPISFELPTGCTDYQVQLLNEAATGELAWHQFEAYENLIDNPSLEDKVTIEVSDAYTLTNGTVSSGSLASTYTQDGTDFVLNEVTGTPGGLYDFEFSYDSNQKARTFCMYGYYDGNLGHTIDVNVYNWDTPGYDTLGQWVDRVADVLECWPLISDHTDVTGVTKIQIDHSSAGNITHDFIMDHVYVTTHAAGDPWIPTGWTNENLDASDTLTETTTIHSGANSLEWATSAVNEGIYINAFGSTAGIYYALGVWSYGDGAVDSRHGPRYTSRGLLQHSTTAVEIFGPGTASWSHSSGVARATTNALDPAVRADASASGLRYLDDYYAIALDPVSLTVAAASEANSAEGDGLRVDGWDTLAQAIPAGQLTPTSGWIRWTWTPRHDCADLDNFGNGLPYLIDLRYDADNRLIVWLSAANTLQLFTEVATVVQTSTSNCAAYVVADTPILLELKYSPASVSWYVDGVETILVNRAVHFGALTPNTVTFGSTAGGAVQSDGVFSAP